MLFFLWKNSCISRLIWPDWESTAWADMTRFGSIGLMKMAFKYIYLISASFHI